MLAKCVIAVCLIIVSNYLVFGLPVPTHYNPELDDRHHSNASVPHHHRLWQPKNRSRDDFLKHYGRSHEEHQWIVNKINSLRRRITGMHAPHLVNEIVDKTDATWEGDMLLSRKQLSAIEQHLNMSELENSSSRRGGGRRRKLRQMDSDISDRWPMPITYKIDGTMTVAQSDVIKAAISAWEAATCVTFKYADVTDNVTSNHLIFTLASNCQSYVGMSSQPEQVIQLSYPGCFYSLGKAAHEIGHALGLIHEQGRADRDNYVQVFLNNIISADVSNFEIIPPALVNTYGRPYDIGSVMHYDAEAFLKSGAHGDYTIKPLDSTLVTVLGQRTEISFYDALLVNKAYCSGECPNPQALSCQQGGYTDPKNCQQCRCPPVWGGRLCDTLAPQSPGCTPQQQVLNLNNDNMISVSSPNFGTGHYPENSLCIWQVTLGVSDVIKFWFDSFPFGIFPLWAPSCQHWVEVWYLTSHKTHGQRFCDSTAPKGEMSTNITTVTVLFSAPYHGPYTLDNSYFIGFRLNFATNSYITNSHIQIKTTSTTASFHDRCLAQCNICLVVCIYWLACLTLLNI